MDLMYKRPDKILGSILTLLHRHIHLLQYSKHLGHTKFYAPLSYKLNLEQDTTRIKLESDLYTFLPPYWPHTLLDYIHEVQFYSYRQNPRIEHISTWLVHLEFHLKRSYLQIFHHFHHCHSYQNEHWQYQHHIVFETIHYVQN